MTRSEDRSFFAAFDYYTTKYKLLLWIAGLFLLALGFDWKTPRAVIHDVQTQITENKKQVDSTIVPAIRAVNIRVDGVEDKVDIQLKNMCFDKTIPSDRAALTGLTDFCESKNLGRRK